MHGDLSGGCSCGRIRFRVQGAPLLIAACHCKYCRQHTGAPVAVYVDVLKTQLEMLAAPIDWFESSPGSHRGFCAQCGSSLAYHGDNLPDEIHMHVGAFDQPELLPPMQNESMESRLPWLHVLIEE